MVNRTSFEDINDGDQLSEGYFNGISDALLQYVGDDQTGATADNTTTETEIGEVYIPANTVSTRVIIFASIRLDGATGENTTIRIRTGTNSSGPSNTTRKSQTISYTDNGDYYMSMYITLTTEENWTTDTYVHVTAEHSTANVNFKANLVSLMVTGN